MKVAALRFRTHYRLTGNNRTQIFPLTPPAHPSKIISPNIADNFQLNCYRVRQQQKKQRRLAT